MLKNLHLGYRINRIFKGESGIVERVEEAPSKDHLKQGISYWKDSYGNCPYQVSFRNPLGELVKDIAYPKIIFERILADTEKNIPISIIHKPGDNFP